MRLFLFCLLPAILAAQNTTWTAEADFNSRYIWRGIAYSRGPVFQPAFWVTRGASSVSVWSNMILNNEPGRGRFDQLFFTASHELALARWRVELTFQGYTWQGLRDEGSARTLELASRITHPLGPLHFVTSNTTDVASYRGSFILDAGLEWKRVRGKWLWEASGVTAFANRKFNRIYIGVDQAAINYLQYSFAVTRKFGNGWYIRPHAELITNISNAIAAGSGNRVVANAGVAFGREF